MDGWESRRRRTPGFDWCIIRLGLPGIIRGVMVDTSHFKGNYPEQCSFEACAVDGHPDVAQLTSEATEWTEILPQSQLKGDSQNPFAIENDQRFTHLRFKIYPDGGVARLRVYGEVVPDWDGLKRIGGEDRSGRGREWRTGAVVQRHVLWPSSQSDHAGTRREHERRLGDETPAWTRDTTGS